MFEYEEYWVDWRLIVYEEFGIAGYWAYQIEAWSIDRFMVEHGRGSFRDPVDAIVEGRRALFVLLIDSFNYEMK